MNQDGIDIRVLWGKLGRPGEERATERGFHPLLCHMIDVAAVVEAMWDSVLAEPAKRQIARGLGLDPERARVWITFLAGLHDVGKGCPAFTLRKEAERLWPLYGGRGGWRGDASEAHHGAVTARELPLILNRDFGVPLSVAKRLAHIAGAHHGRFQPLRDLDQLSHRAVGSGRWTHARSALVSRLVALLEVSPEITSVPKEPDAALSMLLAGLISVADWIGSDDAFFRYAADIDGTWRVRADEYPALARERAQAALTTGGWTTWQQACDQSSFSELFGLPSLRPLQESAVRIADLRVRPGITVIEAPMGEGKTEAALYLADRWGVADGARGLYMALPTQATSNQMFGRVREMLARRYPADAVNLLLLHGHASLSADLNELVREGERLFRPDPGQVYGEQREGGVAAAAWFLGAKRGLLAPFGVGTVDQALMAALQVRHGFVRLFGLAHRVIVIDEVHAYDAYMETLLERLLEWLAALGAPVLLLSATLPRGRKDTLVRAYLRGTSHVNADAVSIAHELYPRITWASADGEVGAERIAGTRPVAPVQLGWIDGDLPDGEAEPFALGELLRERLAGGGCAAVICNTVARAQAVYRALRPYFASLADDGLPVLDLFHARFPHEERVERERRALVRFGKPEGEGVRRPERAVLVATQVVEQSLDLDFDLMVSDMAPADLLLQRSGRLHRHRRERPDRLQTPVLLICRPSTGDSDSPIFSRGDLAVYDEHVLLRSWLALHGQAELRLPEEVDPLIEAVYDDRSCPEDVSGAIEAAWERTRTARERALKEQAGEAEVRWLRPPWYDGPLWRLAEQPRAEDSPELHPAHRAITRLAPPSVTIAALWDTRIGPALDRVGVRGVSLTVRPDRETARGLLLRSVTLTDRRVVRDLLKQEPPAGWAKRAVTRLLRPVVFDSAGEAPVGKWTLRLDPDVGLEIVAGRASEAESEEATE